MSLLALLFVIVPGFVADSVRRVVFGERKTSDFERTIHSLVFSAIGLGAYLAAGAAARGLGVGDQSWFSPPYLPAIADPLGKTGVPVTWLILPTLLLHSLFSSGVALIIVKVVRSKPASWILEHVAGRSLDPAWSIFWAKYYPAKRSERWLTVVSGDQRILGRFLAASDPSEAQDLVLGDPLFWDKERTQWHADGVRVVFVPAGKIDAILLSPVEGESVARGYLDSEFKPLPEGAAKP